eukprot:TRINITY_DN62704_c0_g1_i1.p1 TRINITY_DN62704_c0_g1~~TRINITY_DN62704_c0_g1_i1.p1  ORF type:complete len:358 (-),score=100.69 TRINITY_DN62704_c0_g1_i1:33-1061(-)
MPNVRAVGAGAKEQDIPLLNASETLNPPATKKKDDIVYIDGDDNDDDDGNGGFKTPPSSCGSSLCPDPDSDDDPEQERIRREPDADGKFYDDPLWYGKTRKEIEYATELEKSNGNAASREGDWKKANRYWKNALRGAQKLQDAETEFRLHSNLVLGYTKLKKTDKALSHCDQALKERLKQAVSAELRAKVYYRKAEAYEAAGEVSKAMASIKLSLEVHPDNPDSQKKLSNLKALEAAQRKRERSLFGGFLRRFSSPGESSAKEPVVTGKDGDAANLAEKQQEGLSKSLTDRTAASRLLGSLGYPRQGSTSASSDATMIDPSNMTMHEQVFFGERARDSTKGE